MRLNIGYLLAITGFRFTRYFRVREDHELLAKIVYTLIDVVGSNVTADKFGSYKRNLGPLI